MRVALLGGGTIAQLVLENIQRGALSHLEVVALMGRSVTSRGKAQAEKYGVPFVTSIEVLKEHKPDVVVEAASHDAIRDYAENLLRNGISVIVLSAGALVDDKLKARLEAAAQMSGSLLYVPSGGIGALDALKTAVYSGVEEVTLTTAKPPVAWKNIEYVEELAVDLEGLTEPHVLYEGVAREAVMHFPQNVNIAAVLSLAGVGFDRTKVRIVADPHVRFNTHTIEVSATTGRFQIKLENVPAPENPKTAWLACYSALAALGELKRTSRYGT